MKNLFLLFIPLFFFSCIEVEKEFEVGKELEVVIVEFGDLTSLSDDKQYGNFEIKVPEINNEASGPQGQHRPTGHSGVGVPGIIR